MSVGRRSNANAPPSGRAASRSAHVHAGASCAIESRPSASRTSCTRSWHPGHRDSIGSVTDAPACSWFCGACRGAFFRQRIDHGATSTGSRFELETRLALPASLPTTSGARLSCRRRSGEATRPAARAPNPPGRQAARAARACGALRERHTARGPPARTSGSHASRTDVASPPGRHVERRRRRRLPPTTRLSRVYGPSPSSAGPWAARRVHSCSRWHGNIFLRSSQEGLPPLPGLSAGAPPARPKPARRPDATREQSPRPV